MTEALIGKTIASVEEKQMAGRDTFKDTVTWTSTVLHFTDGTSQEFSSSDAEVYDAFEYTEVNADGWPVDPTENHEWRITIEATDGSDEYEYDIDSNNREDAVQQAYAMAVADGLKAGALWSVKRAEVLS